MDDRRRPTGRTPPLPLPEETRIVTPDQDRAPQDAPGPRSYTADELTQAIEAHAAWLRTDGREGARADFRNAQLRGADLAGADLKHATFVDAVLCRAKLARANLVGADLRGAEFDGADLTGATLRDADLRDADLDGARLRDADFQDADLRDARALVSGQFGGANVSGARLPELIGKFEAVGAVQETSKSAQNLFTSNLLLCAYVWLTVLGTRDAPLLNVAAPTSARLPVLGSDIPLYHFYIVAPLLLVALDLYFRLSLQRLWEELADLPAIFPDGRPLDKKAPAWMLNGLVCLHFERLLRTRSTLAIWQARSAAIVAWGVVPFTLMILWARYIRMHDWQVTALHVALIAITLGAGFGFYRLAIATLRAGGPVSGHKRGWSRSLADVRWSSITVALATMLVLGSVSASLIRGIAVNNLQEEDERRRLLWSGDPRVWMPLVLGKLGIRAFVSMEEVDLSTKPAGWSGKDADIDMVKGADLAGADLRYAEAYGVFLVKGYLKQANLRYADLRAADLRKADLRDADLTGANLREAKLAGADLRRANLHGAKLNGADLTGADLEGATLAGAQLRKADLSKADLTRADFTGADLSEAVLVGTARGGVIFRDATMADAKLDANTPAEAPPTLVAPPLERPKSALPRPVVGTPSVVAKPAGAPAPAPPMPPPAQASSAGGPGSR